MSLYSGHPTTLIIFDIDFFKKVNDQFGHQTGDQVLKEFSRLLIQQFPRKSDFVARYGGEEFVVVLEQDGKNVALNLVSKFQKNLTEKIFFSEDESFSVTSSVGIAEFKSMESIEDWIKRADTALYEAKNSGRNKVVLG